MASLASSMGLILCLNRRDELAVPSWPVESITAGMASGFAVVTPRMWPIKQLLLTSRPGCPIQTTLLAVSILTPALKPKPVLLLPVVLLKNAPVPLAVLPEPVVLLKSAPVPLAVLELPVMLLKSALTPFAVLRLPIVFKPSAP